jgi:hypothetical protein
VGTGSRDEEQSEDGTDDVQEVDTSGSRDSVKPILRFPERNDEDTFWTHTDETKSASVKNKFKSEDMARVRQRKDLLLRNGLRQRTVTHVNRTCECYLF